MNKTRNPWNKTERDYPKDKTIHQLFEEQVERTPENIAVVFEENKLTYAELNAKANQLANTIRNEYYIQWNKKVKSDTLIGIYIERSLEMIIGILGILKSGAAYVPFDSADPEERLKFKISDCGCKMILTSSSSIYDLLFLTETDCLPLSIDGYWDKISEASKINPAHINKSSDLAYIIYTSGSTGKPKGVMIEHKSVINFDSSINRLELMDGNFNSLLVSNFAFDVSVHDIFTTMLHGGTLFLHEKYRLADINQFCSILDINRINTCYIPPFILNDLEMVLNSFHDIKLNRILVGVEPISFSTLSSIYKKLPNIKIINGYGPTEATICSTFYKFLINDSYDRVPIGRSLDNCSIYILDLNNKPVPIGVIGELHIGGVGLSRGYLNRPKLTLEKFVNNPFATKSDIAKGYTRLYKTGDLCRYLPDGNIEFIGRNDDQVKIRGFRIEPGEIESVLNSMEGIKQSCVLAKESNGNKYLVAYYVLNNSTLEASVRTFLGDKLPSYMIPSVFVELENFPLTVNGKLDRKALPDPELTNKDYYAAPTTDLEIKLCNIWMEVLNIEKIGIHDDFFRIGGNSITALKILSRMNDELNIKVRISHLYTYSTIANLHNYISSINTYQNIFLMNSSNKCNRNMFMIHPAHGGCEVYYELAQKLNDSYNCYGVDNFNLYNEDKISDLDKLANYYFDLVKPFEKKEFILLGWSFGGQIALELASILEGYGVKNIKIILLDAVIADKQYLYLLGQIDEKQNSKEIEMYFLNREYDESYIKKIEKNFSSDNNFFIQNISSKLYKSKILLFRCLKRDELFESEKVSDDYILGLPYNNIDLVCDKTNIKVVGLKCHHNNILNKLTEPNSPYIQNIIDFLK